MVDQKLRKLRELRERRSSWGVLEVPWPGVDGLDDGGLEGRSWDGVGSRRDKGKKRKKQKKRKNRG